MANTVIGSSIVIDGEISGDEDLVIQGTVKGKISLKESLFVEGSGVVEADIETQNVEIAGQVTGNIVGQRQGRAEEPTAAWWATSRPRASSSPTAPRFKGNVDMDVKER